ncbi:phosphonate ABC transporter substrate-binding protein [Candidatus Woesearchaeota archaeon]|jgi:phosphonate transport system substrate-binding protein|nr:phosphonate ABC transporter substrate-binding protein [Candidatus Woesearchaeota archaeon]MBT4368840.1 phosphonate ABC transporter substrate-binding protein [Candidatus Woesearchaeota archaeon]MBT4712129.1 phosphonate ABC transporter substrate-binding protein [Candidatus Woesearchaeota archaeon]MBT6639123.1 phosphonate ABC transporter substrate-binding protein [Candidatus Woesearchaeota archaeon]MBT7134323.1 phosphonate ABC transporter substrate-binding protein [Candidatus Woesearchaeota arc
MKKEILVICLILLIALVGCQKEEENVLKMGLIPADDADEMLRNYEPIQEYLSQKLDMPVEIQVTSDYTAAIEAMRAEHIDMAWFGPFSYVIAANVADAEAIVNGVKASTGSATYKSVIIVNAESGIKTLEDLKGKSFAFVDPASTSGNLIPRKMLIENGIDPDKDFSTSFFAGTHNAVQYAIANGKVDAGAAGDNVHQRMIEAGEIDPEINIIIHESEPIPGSPIVVRGSLPAELKTRIQTALLEMDEQTIHKVDGWGGITSYQKVSDSDYDVIRETARLLDMDVSSAEAANK